MARRIALLTSGGDAPGMNAAIRAVVRSGLDLGWEVFGVPRGFAGLVAGEYRPMGPRDVGGIIQLGGTILGSARCPEFKELTTRRRALDNLSAQKVDALVVIGGNGSQSGSAALSEMGLPVVGVASTIDNDLVGSEPTIGVDTALNIALEAIDRLKVTAASHQRGFLVEVMGRDCGYLALVAGITGGAEIVIVPEMPVEPDDVARILQRAYKVGKPHAIAVVAEGARYNADALVKHFEEHRHEIGFPLRATRLGHVQRGGAPGAADRLLASRLGFAATQALAEGRHGVLVGLVGGCVTATPLAEVVGRIKPLDPQLLALAPVLAK